MKSIIAVTLTAFGLAILGSVAVLGYQDVEGHGHQLNTFTVDVAVDCRTAVDEFKRGANVIINGKLFAAGTLPSGPASNDPTLPVNGVAPIGDWLLRGQHSLPLLLPDDIAQRYRSAPGDFRHRLLHPERGANFVNCRILCFPQRDWTPNVSFRGGDWRRRPFP